jgi:hypothetical protein
MRFDISFIQEWAHWYVEWAEGLDPDQIIILTALTAVLFLFIAYRWFGYGGFAAMLIIMLLGYALYVADIINFYKEHTYEKDQHMQEIQEAIDRNFEG